MNEIRLIGISGQIGNGKDTVADLILKLTSNFNSQESNSEWEIKKFASILKKITALIIGCDVSDLEKESFKNTPLGEEWRRYYIYRDAQFDNHNQGGIIGKYYSSKFEAENNVPEYLKGKVEIIDEILTPRLILQLLGTEGGRDVIHPNLWVSSLFSCYDIEIWKEIKNYENEYECSTYGNIRNFKTKKILLPTLSGKYLTVGLKGKTHTLHSIIAENFVSGKCDGYVVNHKDFNTKNNYHKNLEWCAQSKNIQHNKNYGKHSFGEKQKDSKLKDFDVEIINFLLENKIPQNKIAELYSVSTTTISDIKNKKKWSHVGIRRETIKPIVPIKWIISDVRFPNEVYEIKKRKGIVVRVVRPSKISTSTHPSEISLNDYKDWDYVIVNDGTLEELELKVIEMLNYFNILNVRPTIPLYFVEPKYRSND